MAEVTYYWDETQLTTSGWDDYLKAADGNLTTFAYTSTNGHRLLLRSTNCPGTDLGTIIKVELRCYGYGDGDDRIDISFTTGLVPVSPEYQFTMPASEGWSSYADVTSDPNIAGWTWAKIADLYAETSMRLFAELDKVGKGNTIYCAKGEVRVTFTEVGAKTTQYLAGDDCPEFPHEMDVQSDKLPCPPPY